MVLDDGYGYGYGQNSPVHEERYEVEEERYDVEEERHSHLDHHGYHGHHGHHGSPGGSVQWRKAMYDSYGPRVEHHHKPTPVYGGKVHSYYAGNAGSGGSEPGSYYYGDQLRVPSSPWQADQVVAPEYGRVKGYVPTPAGYTTYEAKAYGEKSWKEELVPQEPRLIHGIKP